MAKHSKPIFEPEHASRRKLPQQARAEQTVDRIKRAMLELIAEGGYAEVSTNRVAKRARVNISSLYQYFPNRQSIALAIYEDAAARQAQIVHDEMMEGMSESLEVGLARLMDKLLAFLEREHMAVLHLVDEVPDLRRIVGAMSLQNLAHNTNRIYVARHLQSLDETALNRKQFFVEHIGLSLLRNYILDKPADISREYFLAEVTDILVQYLRKPEPTLQSKRAFAAKPAL